MESSGLLADFNQFNGSRLKRERQPEFGLSVVEKRNEPWDS